jgi:maltose/moltooligosaccharide transporter
MMGTPYVMLAGSIPPERTGVYMGILNMFIVLPMMLQTLTFKWVYQWLGKDPALAIQFAGGLIVVAALLVLRITINPAAAKAPVTLRGGGH